MSPSRSIELAPSKRFVEFVRDERDHDREAFNRIAYAKHLLRILAPRGRVALCVGEDRLRVEQGGLPGLPRLGRWAIVSIPRDASRVHIAMAMARLAGREDEPFLLDVLLRARPA
jgi:hypothetical protein